MKQFIVDRHTTPNTPTLEQVPTDKIPIYDTLSDAESDLSNLSVGQIIATSDTGDEATLKAELKTIVANSTDFADFQTNIANW
jgi:hypothetical protein